MAGHKILNQYICLDCGKQFDTPKHFIEKHGLDTPPYEEYDGCPFCGGEFSKVMFCDGCGEAIIGDYAQIEPIGKRYCEACYSIKSI